LIRVVAGVVLHTARRATAMQQQLLPDPLQRVRRALDPMVQLDRVMRKQHLRSCDCPLVGAAARL